MVEKTSFDRSNQLRDEVLNIIPLGAQTFTRSYTQFPYNYSPLFVTRGEGSHIWDVDNNEYIDLLSGLLSVILGYCDPDVNKAISDQLQKGITFSLSSELEAELANLLIKHIPSAEMVRFGKNGSDCTSASIRLARYVTKRDHVGMCGYHGWHDWYAGITTLHHGVPDVVSQLAHTFAYNDIDSLQKIFDGFPEQVAAIIMEPINIEEPKDGFLEKVRELADKNGTLLIFDEVITGFRYDIGGAQTYFSVTPDLSVFGKAMGNGMPISALVGKKIYMQNMTKIFFSSTFAPETLSLAASIETIKKISRENVIDKIWEKGNYLKKHVNKFIQKHQLENFIKLKGLAPWVIVTFHDYPHVSAAVLRTLFQKEMIQNGILILTSHNINYALSEEDMNKILEVYDKTLCKISELIRTSKLDESLDTKLLEPVFTVRRYK